MKSENDKSGNDKGKEEDNIKDEYEINQHYNELNIQKSKHGR